MKIKLYFPSGRVSTHYHNIEALKKSFESAGMYYEVTYDNKNQDRTKKETDQKQSS